MGTIVIMIISAMYTIRNIKRVWCLGSVKKKRTAAAANREKNNEKKDQQGNNYKEKKKDARRGQGDKEECVAAATTTTPKNGTKSSYQELSESDEERREPPDPVQYYHHIPSEVKKARQRAAIKNIKSQLTQEELEEEKAIQKKQLQEMFDLMKSQGDKFGLTDSEMEKQMQLYSI